MTPWADGSWVTMFEAMDLGFTYAQLESHVRSGEVETRRSGAAVLYERGSLLRCLAAADSGDRSRA